MTVRTLDRDSRFLPGSVGSSSHSCGISIWLICPILSFIVIDVSSFWMAWSSIALAIALSSAKTTRTRPMRLPIENIFLPHECSLTEDLRLGVSWHCFLESTVCFSQRILSRRNQSQSPSPRMLLKTTLGFCFLSFKAGKITSSRMLLKTGLGFVFCRQPAERRRSLGIEKVTLNPVSNRSHK